MGEIFVFSASTLLALSTVFAHYMTKGIDPLVIVFYSFLISFIFFNVAGIKNKTFFNLVKLNWKWVLFVNISTALDWLLIFIALKYISAALINCFVFGAAPVATLILAFKNYTSKGLFLKDVIVCLLISSLLLILSLIYYHNNINIHGTSEIDIKWGIFLSCISGLATGATVYGSKILQSCEFTTNSVMRCRFVVIVIMAIALLQWNQIGYALTYSAANNIVLLSFIFVIIPTFLLQKGIERTLPVVTTIITSLIPVLTYLFQFFEPGFMFDLKEIVIIIVLSMVVFIATRLKQQGRA